MLQILSVMPFEKMPMFQLTCSAAAENFNDDPNQLILL